ncbi:hypothetical protein AB6D66_01440 [Vibrio pomeroyi]|uniref:Phage protein n=1 Tax=Vibrio pomeroyi TaxID=198832 RepID=A0ABV4MRG2_9VIBR|nr:hypothetical protein [Vibrio atlanticus]MCZ4310212.1 hypothetical protein [Vibrio atlanticus]
MTNPHLVLMAFAAIVAFLTVLIKYIRLKNGLIQLKEKMKEHTLIHGVDDQLWDMFVKETRKLVGAKRGK